MAIAEAEGPERGLDDVRSIADVDRLRPYPFYEAALGELELRCGRREPARKHFQLALRLARNAAEQRFLTRRCAECEAGS
jgi:RNA polymerase sigma-70 factor (ECF subfamily)